jgi:hypothetical protein
MPSDASIYSMIRPPVAGPGPLEQYTQALQVKGLMGQQELQGMQRQQMQKQIAEDDATSAAYREAGGDSAKVRELLYGRGLYKPALAAEKSALETQEKRGNIAKTSAETLAKSLSINRDMLSSVNDPQSAAQWVIAGFNDPILSPIMQKKGSPQEIIAKIPQDPQAFMRWKMENGLGITEFMKAIESKMVGVDTGKTNILRETNPNAPGFTNAPVVKTTTPGEDLSAQTTRRGQDIGATTAREGHEVTRAGQLATDARERDVGLQGAIAGARVLGKEGAEAKLALPQAVSNAERATRLIDEMIGSAGKTLKPGEKAVAAHPGFQTAVGATLTPGLRFVEGTHTADFMRRLDEIKGGAFLQAFESLKGGGQITEVEGRKATEAITRMDKSQSEAEFVRAARDFQDVIRKGVERAKQKATAPGADPKKLSDAELKRELGL